MCRAWDKNHKCFWYELPIGFELKLDGKIFLYDMPTEEIVLVRKTGVMDINGDDVYEGDIVDIGKVMKRFCIIEFKNAKFSLKFLDDFEKGSPTDIDFFIDRIKIVGNIYQTPELIGQSLGGVTNTI